LKEEVFAAEVALSAEIEAVASTEATTFLNQSKKERNTT
jgi:hypothetical protein